MGVDKEALRTTLRCHIKSFINEISPTVIKEVYIINLLLYIVTIDI